MEKLQFKETIDLVKSKLTLQDVMRYYGITIKSENKLLACPFHQDSTPSMKIYNSTGVDGSFFCFGCRASGDIVSFVCKMENKTNIEALNSLCLRLNLDPVTRESANYLINSITNILTPKTPKPSMEINYFKISLKAKTDFESVSTQNITPYLLKKGVPHIGTKSRGTSVLVPVCDENEKIWNLQTITSDGGKFYIKDGKRKGCMFKLWSRILTDKFAYICEGYSTAASVAISTGLTTYVAFTAGNIRNVHDILKEKYGSIKLVVAGDNDSPGRMKMLGLDVIYPPEKDFDWNDHYLKYGPESVNKLLGGSVEKVL